MSFLQLELRRLERQMRRARQRRGLRAAARACRATRQRVKDEMNAAMGQAS